MTLQGPRTVVGFDDTRYPLSLKLVDHAPEKLYIIGNVEALVPGLAIIGARKATPYGRSITRHFSKLAAQKGIAIISGGARGCDSEAHRAALEVNGTCVVFLGGGCDRIYPADHERLFQNIIDTGGAIVSEHTWNRDPRPFYFRERNRLIAGLSHAVLIAEAGLPSGTFSTADDALNLGKDVLVVPGAITANTSRGSNRLLLQGAVPVVDDESFEDALLTAFGALKRPTTDELDFDISSPVVAAIRSEPLKLEELLNVAIEAYGKDDAQSRLMEDLAIAEAQGIVARQADGRWTAIATPHRRSS